MARRIDNRKLDDTLISYAKYACAARNALRYFQPLIFALKIPPRVPQMEALKMKRRSWPETDGGKLLNKWFQSACEINISSGGSSSKHFSIKKGLIEELSPDLIRLRGPDGRTVEMSLSDEVIFEDVVSAEMVRSVPALEGRVYGEQLILGMGWERWLTFGPAEIEGK
ncbi:MAG: hypothetical protein ACRD28_03480 [Acidobacteriaceae bacterium]